MTIRDALAPVLRDVEQTTDINLRIESRGQDVDLGSNIWVTAPGGGTTGLLINLDEPEPDRVRAAADQVQDIVIEAMWARASNWPMCPAHRSTHPMQASVSAGEAWWRCPADGTPVVLVGDLRL